MTYVHTRTPVIGVSCHKYDLKAATKLLSRQTMSRQNILSRQMFCRDKQVFVVTVVSLSRQNLCRNKMMFVAIKICSSRQAYFCNDKSRGCRDKNQKQKQILVAVPSNTPTRFQLDLTLMHVLLTLICALTLLGHGLLETSGCST